jgi:hypothetical protein
MAATKNSEKTICLLFNRQTAGRFVSQSLDIGKTAFFRIQDIKTDLCCFDRTKKQL